MGPYLQCLSNLPWKLGFLEFGSPPWVFASRHQVVSDSSQDSGFQWNGPNSLGQQQLEITNFPIRSHLSTNEKHWTQRSGKPRFAILLRKKPSLFFQERELMEQMYLYIYIHTFIYSLFVQHMYIIYTYMYMPISIVKLETRLKLCRPVFTKKQSFKFPVVGNGILNATSGWELHCSSHAKICTYSGPRGSWKSIASLSNGRYHNTLRGFGKSQNMTVDNMQEAKQRSSEVLSKLTGLHDTDSRNSLTSETNNNTLQHWKQRPIQLNPIPKFLFNVAAIKSTKGADSPSPKKERVSAVEDVPPSCQESNVFAKDIRAAMHFMWGLGYFRLTYKFHKQGVSLNPLHGYCQKVLAKLVTLVQHERHHTKTRAWIALTLRASAKGVLRTWPKSSPGGGI